MQVLFLTNVYQINVEKQELLEGVSEILTLLEEQEQQESLKLFHCNAFLKINIIHMPHYLCR